MFIFSALLYDFATAKFGHVSWIDYIDDKFTENIILPFFLITLALIPLFLLLLFNKPPVYSTWKKFAIPYLVIYAFLALPLGKLSGGDGIYSGATPSVGKETGMMFLAALFFIISLLIIIIKSIKLAEKPKQAESEKSRQLPWR